MIKHLSFVRLTVLSAVAATFFAVALPVKVHADTTQHASVTLKMADGAQVAISDAPNINFGTTAINSNGTDKDADNIDAPVTVTNPGFADGWTLKVAASNFTDAQTNRTIKSAQMTFDTATVAADDQNNVSAAPVAQQAVLTTGGAAQKIVGAADHAGVGTFSATFNPSNVHLHIPAGNVEGNYSADLTWTLVNGVED
ncbi:WxL domain-containing protein [Lacticaseibacillus manihotivorans]|uniref:WxL domain-containing protein n=2 Tax=Lacticaseibacillus manihotivorans TaxID=88233 RepID=A0A0R1Q4P8_9LACO|nr:WxL domain-containing protein [Lacticaseibacillus manihotivorans]KRL39567.1 hypothetical protein FD01_GL002469 [Lacticaseibacillus manihotivorans DSM 13343 = JCM 12514]QFQ90436.1 hypothetical protein LM010_02875 [Lacticaseibacillus manihotivorans]